ncbi:exo-alpha-sialidase [Helicobacter cetorum]|uniref:exo-alpha-sialidase n=1 Tax=Helicobacter cetorum TaxID=138563 RepID=UPI000CF1968E|nr:exo-alpha-sialidase [Helicobacter cetorum]
MEHSRNLLTLKNLAFLLALLSVLTFIINKHQHPNYTFNPNKPLLTHNKPFFSKLDIPKPKNAPMVHASSLISLPNKTLLVAYFSGTREGAKDVQINANIYNPNTKKWGEAFILLTRETLSKSAHEYIKKLGNPLLFWHKNKILLFVVGVSMGGWATSKIYQLESPSIDKPFKLVRSLHLSPFLNLSHLVRTQALNTDDGGFILPLYHELARQYPLLLKFDFKANPIELFRPNLLHAQLQPSITPYKKCAIMAFRNHNFSNALMLQTCLSPTKWQPLILTNFKNLDDSLNLLNLNNTLYLIHNPNNLSLRRQELLISQLKNDNTFHTLSILDKANEASYPSTLIDNNFIDITYTYNRQTIRHIRFNLAYLNSLLSLQP